MKTTKRKSFVIAILVLFSLTPVLWFIGKGEFIINGVDTNYPLDPLKWFLRRFYVWNNQVNGGADFSSSTSGLFFHSLQAIPYMLGVNIHNTQILTFIFWFSSLVASSYRFSSSIFKNSYLPRIVFVVIYCYNTYLFNTWENVKVSNLALVFAIPWFLSLLLDIKSGVITLKKFLLFSVIGVIVSSGAGINPAYIIAIILPLIIWFVVNLLFAREDNFKDKVLLPLLYLLVLIVLINAFWILPTLNFLLIGKQIANLSDIGFTNWIDSLSEHTSLFNVLRLQGAWDWYAFESTGAPTYLPYAHNYLFRIPFLLFSSLLPLLVFVSIATVHTKKRILSIFLCSLLLLGIFLGSGTHPPLGVLYKFLVLHLPFFSFFRSPWYIFTPFVVLSYAAFIGLLINWAKKKYVLLSVILALVVIVGNLVYSYPLVTGKIFRPSKSDGFYVKFPTYVWDTKKELDGKDSFPRILVYPDDTLESFSWGYKGVDSIISLFSQKEYISPFPGLGNNPFGLILSDIYKFIKRGDYHSAFATLKVLGADTIMYKEDGVSLSPPIRSSIEEISTLQLLGKWRFYTAKDNNLSKIYAATHGYLSNTPVAESIAHASSFLESSPVILDSNEIHSEQTLGIDSYLSSKFVHYTQAKSKTGVTTKEQDFTLEIEKSGEYMIIVEDYDINSQLPIETFIGSEQLVEIKSETQGYRSYGPVVLSKGAHVIHVVFPETENLINITNFENYAQVLGLRSSDLPENIQSTLVAYADKEHVIQIPIKQLDPLMRYELSFDYQYNYGSLPVIELHQYNSSSPLKKVSLEMNVSVDWEKYRHIVEIAPIESKVDLFIVFPKQEYGARSKSLFENISLKKIYNNQILAKATDVSQNNLNVPKLNVENKNPTEYRVSVSDAQESYFLVFSENYSKDWDIKVSGAQIEPLHVMVNGYANGWYIPASDTHDYNLTILYKPQKLYRIGIIISISSVIFILGVYFYRRNEKQ